MRSIVDDIMAYEDGTMETDDEVISFFGRLIATRMIDHLQGHYGRTAANLVAKGILSPKGEVLTFIGRGITPGQEGVDILDGL